ncbi:MAG: hypothetical protein WKG06_13620 [Segetibacter sp.]
MQVLSLLNTGADENAGMTHYRYYQTYKGVPVENADVYRTHAARQINLDERVCCH